MFKEVVFGDQLKWTKFCNRNYITAQNITKSVGFIVHGDDETINIQIKSAATSKKKLIITIFTFYISNLVIWKEQ